MITKDARPSAIAISLNQFSEHFIAVPLVLHVHFLVTQVKVQNRVSKHASRFSKHALTFLTPTSETNSTACVARSGVEHEFAYPKHANHAPPAGRPDSFDERITEQRVGLQISILMFGVGFSTAIVPKT